MKINFHSFRTQVALLLIPALLLITGVSGVLIDHFAIDTQFAQFRSQLMSLAQVVALSVDAELVGTIPLNPAGADTAQYKTLVRHLKRTLGSGRPIKAIYIMSKTDREGILQFVADTGLTATDRRDKGPPLPGYQYDAFRSPAMFKGFEGPSADERLVNDEWGVTLSGYAPIRNGQGRSIAILGVDMDATDIYNARRAIYGKILIILALGLIISLVVALILSRRISGPIEKLTDGTRHIAEGDMSYRIAEGGVNEIRELARSFNDMTGSLSEARKKLRDYFIRVVQSFVLSLEAKDPYTGGHSERVAAYAGRIAAGMGLPMERVQALKEVALLHDIGKMGVAEIILNKTEPLVQTEWDSIRNHPSVGGKILEPVLDDEELLSVVTGHHERIDGTGYPLGLAGEKITIYARITAVADTYDAMTSSRAYRKALSKETAIAELQRSRGTQLDPEVVDVFVEVLKGEGVAPGRCL